MRYSEFNKNNQGQFYFPQELIIDNFAGGGGASIGIELGCGRPVDHAINHDPIALAMHEANHPFTKHWNESVWDIDILKLTKGLPVGLAWFSPDCTHFSKAKGSKPVRKNIRGLAWIVLRWISKARPRIIMLENVKEFVTWGPLVGDQPCPKRKGKNFRAFINAIKRQGYNVEYKELAADHHGAPTTRPRFFMIARCDGQPIVWPKQTFVNPKLDKAKNNKLKKWKTTAENIDWSLETPSIFERKKPLVENTERRLYNGIKKFVIDDPQPFIVRIGQTGFGGDNLVYSTERPLTTITSKAEHCLVIPFITRHFSNSVGHRLDEPLRTIMPQGGGKSSLSCVFLHSVSSLRTDHSEEVYAFIMKYYGQGVGQSINEPLHTITSKDRFALVTVQSKLYRIVDIGFRMLQPHELYACQGFPKDYQFAIEYNGKKLSKAEQVKKCGNSVPPPVVSALVKANYQERQQSTLLQKEN